MRWVSLDMSDSYRSFARSLFPNAQLVADKFHVSRLITPAIHRALRDLKLPKEAPPMSRMLRKNPCKLSPDWRWKIRCWLADKPVLRELYAVKEAINRHLPDAGSPLRQQGPDRPHRQDGALDLAGGPDAEVDPHALAARGAGLLPLPRHQRPNRGLQWQG